VSQKVCVTLSGPEGSPYTRDFEGDEFVVGSQGELEIINNARTVAVVAGSDWICAEIKEQAN
jgi:hypothetical protein